MRLGLNKDLSFHQRIELKTLEELQEVAKLFSQAGFIVIVSLISPYRSERKKS